MAVASTTTRILEAGARLVRRDGVAAVRMADIADAAGVSRQAVYLHYPNRAELLTAIARHLDVTSPQGRAVVEATAREPARHALDVFVRAYYRYLPTALPLLVALDAAAHSDDAARAAWANRKAVMHGMVASIVRRLEADLRDGWSVSRASDWIFVKLSPLSWNELVHERGWRPRDVVETVLDEIEQILLRREPRRRG